MTTPAEYEAEIGRLREACRAAKPCLQDWINTTGFGKVNARDKAALALIDAALSTPHGESQVEKDARALAALENNPNHLLQMLAYNPLNSHWGFWDRKERNSMWYPTFADAILALEQKETSK